MVAAGVVWQQGPWTSTLRLRYMGARALLESCCHPYYNEVPADARGNRPRIYFEGNNVDNDAATGLIELLKSRNEPWGVVVISKSGGTLETAAATRIFLRPVATGGGTVSAESSTAQAA